MKKVNKILSVLLSLIMVFSIIPMTSITASAATPGTCGDSVTWSFNEFTGTLTISGTGAMYDFDDGYLPWLSCIDKIKKVVINNGVTSVGNGAFYYSLGGCSSLTSVIIPDSVEYIGYEAFAFCNNLISVTIPESVTRIGEYAFFGCDSLTEIIVDNNNQNYSSDNYGVLFNKDKTELVQYPIGNTRKSYTIPDGVIDAGYRSFEGCINITNVIIPKSVDVGLENSFWGCLNLEEFVVDSENQSYSSDGGVLFDKNKTSLRRYPTGNIRTSYTVPNGVTFICEDAFEACNNLTSVVVSDSVNNIQFNAFCDCNSLTDITLPTSVTWIANYAFYSCEKLRDVYYAGTEEQWNDIDIGSDNECLTNATIHFNSNTNAVSGTCGDNVTWSFNESTGTLTISGTGAMYDYYFDADNGTYNRPWEGYIYDIETVVINNGVQSIGENAFHSFNNLEDIMIPDSVTTIGAYAFAYCGNLTDIAIPKNVTEIGYRCFLNSLENITVDENNRYYSSVDGVLFNKDKTILVQYPVDNARTSYTVPNSVATIGDNAFYGSYNLRKVTISNSVTTIGEYAFFVCGNLTNIIIPNSVEQIAYYAFGRCDNLEDITILGDTTQIGRYAFEDTGYYNDERNWINDILYIDNCLIAVRKDISGAFQVKSGTRIIAGYAFYDFENLTSVTIPDSVIAIGECAFSGTSLISATIGNKVLIIGNSAFSWCTNLASVTIGDSVTTIDEGAFYACDSLTDVYYSGTEEQWHEISISTSNYSLQEANIHFNSNTEEDIYNLGEETYSFDNFGDSDSAGGHCFGMSITSAGYYNNILDITSIGGSAEKDLYKLSKTSKVKNPICHYQAIQGDFARSAIVAGGNWYLTKTNNINADWNAVVNYVKNHQYDNKGTLQIGFRNSKGGHAINFLRYEVVNGQERIYAYDNNFPETETYFYKSADGNVYQAPKSTFGTAIDTICLRDIYTYFSGIGEYDKTRYIYGDANEIDVVGAEAFAMECGEVNYTMFELPEEATEAVIIPLVDDASFQYVGEEFSFGDVDENTVGCLILSTNEDDSITEPEFNVEENSCADGHNFYYGFCTVCGESDVIESSHPYDNNTDETYIIYKEYASFIFIDFSRDTYVEEGYDFIEIYDKDDNLIGSYTGDELASEQIQVDGDTVKVKLVSDGSTTGYGFTINEMGYIIIPSTDAGYEFYIQQPSITTIRNKDAINLHAVVDGDAPEGSYIEWESSNKNFSLGRYIGDDKRVLATAENKGYTTFTATLYDADGNVLVTDSVELYSNSGFFQKIGGFFRMLFGATKTYYN